MGYCSTLSQTRTETLGGTTQAGALMWWYQSEDLQLLTSLWRSLRQQPDPRIPHGLRLFQYRTPQPSLAASPLGAEFENVPASHNGEDAIRFQLRFTDPVSTSYKTLRDIAIQAENGTVVESRRVNGRNDLWEITVAPDGTGEHGNHADCTDKL